MVQRGGKDSSLLFGSSPYLYSTEFFFPLCPCVLCFLCEIPIEMLGFVIFLGAFGIDIGQCNPQLNRALLWKRKPSAKILSFDILQVVQFGIKSFSIPWVGNGFIASLLPQQELKAVDVQ